MSVVAAPLVADAALAGESEALREARWKRPLDVLIAVLLLLLSAPLWALSGLLIKLDSPGPVLFIQPAVGRGGRQFRFYKFRTMVADNDRRAHRRYLQAFVRGDAKQEKGMYKMGADPRLTRVGKLLRRASLDELPQILNVLKGDMSIVGPRPPLPYEYELYGAWAKRRLAVRPGITGLYQITGRSRVPFREMVEIDLSYIGNRSLLMDLSIILWTPAAMVIGRGAA